MAARADRMSGDGAPAVTRIEGLDAWRAALMLLGVLLHATKIKEPHPLFDIVAFASTIFRMGAFFAISGFLAGMTVSRHSADAWQRRRMLQIAMPTAFGLLAICPAISALYFAVPAPLYSGTVVVVDWHHMWFLVALLLYTPIAAGLQHADSAHGLFARLDAAPPSVMRIQTIALLVIPLFGICAIAIVMAALEWLASPYWAPLAQVRLMLAYAPLYVMGIALARSGCVRDALLVRPTVAPVVLLAFVAAYLAIRFGLSGMDAGQRETVLRYVIDIGSAFCPPAATILILRSALAVRRVPRFVTSLSKAALTIYIVHFPIVTAINIAFAHVAWPLVLEWLIAVVLAAGVSYGIHVRVVARSACAALLLNGRLPAVARAPGDTAGAA